MRKATFSILCVCIFAIGALAQTTAPPPPATTAGNVWRVVFFKVKPGKTTDYLNFLRSRTRLIFGE